MKNKFLCRSGYRSRCKPCAQRWSFLADWKRLMLQKVFSHSFWCTRDTWIFFVPNNVCFWRKGKCFTLLSQLATFFSKQLSYLRPIFVNLSTEKHLYCQLIVAFEKKRLKNESWKKTKSLAVKKSRISEDFLDLSTENKEISKVLYSLFVWSMKSVERFSQSIRVKWKQSSSSQKKH